MKINFDLKCKIPSVEFCYNNKRVIIRYWGRLKFDKFVFYGGEEMSIERNIEQDRKYWYAKGKLDGSWQAFWVCFWIQTLINFCLMIWR